jgi:hypothetical protein
LLLEIGSFARERVTSAAQQLAQTQAWRKKRDQMINNSTDDL